MFEEKVRVVETVGGSEPKGYIDAKVNMQVWTSDQGDAYYIVSASEGVCGLALTEGGDEATRAYAQHLITTEDHVTTDWSWPSGDGSYLLGMRNALEGVDLTPDNPNGTFATGKNPGSYT